MPENCWSLTVADRKPQTVRDFKYEPAVASRKHELKGIRNNAMIAQPPCRPNEPRQVPTYILERFTELKSKVRYPELRARAWNRLLTEDERQRVLKKDLGSDIVRIWSYAKNVSLDRAVIELARKLNFLFPDEDQELLAYVEPHALASVVSTQQDMPSFHDGKLWLGDRVICRPRRRRGDGSRKEILFKAFQNANWKKVIENPYHNKDEDYLYKALQDANQGVDGLRFASLRRAAEIEWEFVELVSQSSVKRS
jgi:hypothetical protein